MKKIKYDINIMKYMSLFESVTHAGLKDCIVNNKLTFIVQEGDIGKAVGKNGSNVKMLENLIKKKVRMVEFSDNVADFIKNLIHPTEVSDIKEENGIVTISVGSSESKAILIGRDKRNLDALKNIVKRYFDIEDIQIL